MENKRKKTVLDVLREMLRKETSPLEVMEISYRIGVLSISRELKDMQLGGKEDVKQHYAMLMNLKYLMLMHSRDDSDYQKFLDKLNVVFFPISRIYPAKTEDYERKMLPIIKAAENIWYEYRQGIRKF